MKSHAKKCFKEKIKRAMKHAIKRKMEEFDASDGNINVMVITVILGINYYLAILSIVIMVIVVIQVSYII